MFSRCGEATKVEVVGRLWSTTQLLNLRGAEPAYRGTSVFPMVTEKSSTISLLLSEELALEKALWRRKSSRKDQNLRILSVSQKFSEVRMTWFDLKAPPIFNPDNFNQIDRRILA